MTLRTERDTLSGLYTDAAEQFGRNLADQQTGRVKSEEELRALREKVLTEFGYTGASDVGMLLI